MIDRGPHRLPVLPDFVAELQSSWAAPSTSALPRTQLASLAGAESYGLVAAPMVGPTFAGLLGRVAATYGIFCP